MCRISDLGVINFFGNNYLSIVSQPLVDRFPIVPQTLLSRYENGLGIRSGKKRFDALVTEIHVIEGPNLTVKGRPGKVPARRWHDCVLLIGIVVGARISFEMADKLL
jgi:hypothetical protein